MDSDKVFIHNFLADYSPTWGHPPQHDTDEFRHEICNDLKILLHLRPLIDVGRVVLFTPTQVLCPYCYAKLVFGTDADKRLKTAEELLEQELFERTSVDIYKDDEGYAASLKTGEGYFRHPEHIRPLDSISDSITLSSNFVKRIDSGEVINLRPAEIEKIGLRLNMAEDVFPSLRYQLSVSEVLGTAFLTDREVDLKIFCFYRNLW